MALLTNRIKGTQDIMPETSGRQRFLENTLFEIAGTFTSNNSAIAF